MKHSEINSNQNSFGIQLSSLDINKPFSISEQGISVSSSNTNTLMINPVIPAHININSGALINTTLNNQRSINLAILAKPNNASTTSLNTNLSSLTLHPNNTIKFVNLSKCQSISNINKDNNASVQNNTINVQFVSNTSNTGCVNEPSISIQPNCKIDSITLNSNSLTTSTTNQTISTASSSLAGTRFVFQGASQFLQFIPQSTELANNSITKNNLIKNPKYVLSGNKHQTIRPITTGTVSVANQNNIKQSISIISPSKSISNFGSISTLTMPELSNQTVIQDLTVNRSLAVQNDSHKQLSKTQPVKIPLHSYSVSTNSSNNIRLALTSNINNSRVNMNQSKIQLISPKSRKRSGSPVNAVHENKIRNPPIISKDENVDSSINFINQVGNYSPTRKRARKQHLKSVSTKTQKPVLNQKLLLNNKIEPANHLNHIRPATNEKILPNAVVVPTTSKPLNVSLQNKNDDNNPIPTPINTPIFIGIKNQIQICPSKSSSNNQTISHRPTTIYPNNNIIVSNSSSACNNNNNNANISSVNQFQIISQTQNIKQIQLSPNIIISPKGKCQTTFSPSKVIHIAPSIATINRNTLIKSEILANDSISSSIINADKPIVTMDKKEKSIEPIKLETSDIKSETSEDSTIKISLFPIKYNWNPRRNHFLKKSDVKFKKTKSTPTSKFPSNLPSSETQEDENSTESVEINDMNWFFNKALDQILMQKNFDEENLKTIYKLKEKFDVSPRINDLNKPIFRKICAQTQFFAPIPNQIDTNCLSQYTDPNLFGISDDIIENYVNSISKNDRENSESTLSYSQSHECTASCILYSLEVPLTSQPQKYNKILDLIEGLIVKEKNIIEKESEINNQFLKFLRHTTDFTSQNKKSSNKTINHTNRFKLLTGYRR